VGAASRRELLLFAFLPKKTGAKARGGTPLPRLSVRIDNIARMK
jgi:hypothetical protein